MWGGILDAALLLLLLLLRWYIRIASDEYMGNSFHGFTARRTSPLNV
jgi:hypothetical protein